MINATQAPLTPQVNRQHIINDELAYQFDDEWSELREQTTELIGKIHDRQYKKALTEILTDPELRAWLPKSKEFDVTVMGRKIALYSDAHHPNKFESVWPDMNRRALWWVTQKLPASRELYYKASCGTSLQLRVREHLDEATRLREQVIDLLKKEVDFKVNINKYIDSLSIGNLTTFRSNITSWARSQGQCQESRIS